MHLINGHFWTYLHLELVFLTLSPGRSPGCMALAADRGGLVSHSVRLLHLKAVHKAVYHIPQFPKVLLQMTCKIKQTVRNRNLRK